MDRRSSSKVYSCWICGLSVKANSVLCEVCCKSIIGRSGAKRVVRPQSLTLFACLGGKVRTSGGCEAALIAMM